MIPPRLTMTGVRKSYGLTPALDGVDLELHPGEVHALVGENGAGKSTLMKILSGAVAPDAGQLKLDGEVYAPTDPRDARRRGVAMVYQERTLCTDLTVEENILLGLEQTSFGFLRRESNHRRVRDVLAMLEHPEIQPEALVSELGPGACQLVEIARGLITEVRVLILDEPTSALSQTDASRLFALIRRLRDRGVTVVYISHFLEEIEEVADRLTVLRDGRSVAAGTVREFTRESMIQHMVGRSMTEQYPHPLREIGSPVLELSRVCGERLPIDVNLTLHRGEILGLAGIIGAGRTELLRVIFALEPVRSGNIRIREIHPPGRSPAQCIRQGLGLLSEDRKTEGLALEQSIVDNLTYSRLHPYSRFGFLDRTRWRSAARNWLERLRVRFTDLDQPVGHLSGGNQQKVALARLLHQEADVLLLDEPTKGVDVGSKAEIYQLINKLAGQGKAVLFVSSYLPELLGVCDRIAVMCRGKIAAVRPTCEWQPEQIMALAMGAERGE